MRGCYRFPEDQDKKRPASQKEALRATAAQKWRVGAGLSVMPLAVAKEIVTQVGSLQCNDKGSRKQSQLKHESENPSWDITSYL